MMVAGKAGLHDLAYHLANDATQGVLCENIVTDMILAHCGVPILHAG